MIYLASPYTHKDVNVMQARYEAVRDFVGNQITQSTDRGHNRMAILYSPIIHYHSIAVAWELPREFEFWAYVNDSMIARADAVIVLQLPGWEESRGIIHEIAYAKELGKSISFVSI